MPLLVAKPTLGAAAIRRYRLSLARNLDFLWTLDTGGSRSCRNPRLAGLHPPPAARCRCSRVNIHHLRPDPRPHPPRTHGPAATPSCTPSPVSPPTSVPGFSDMSAIATGSTLPCWPLRSFRCWPCRRLFSCRRLGRRRIELFRSGLCRPMTATNGCHPPHCCHEPNSPFVPSIAAAGAITKYARFRYRVFSLEKIADKLFDSCNKN